MMLKTLKRAVTTTALCTGVLTGIVTGLTTGLFVGSGGAVMAQTQTQAQSELALRGLEGQIAALKAAPDTNLFELGALEALRAVEKSLQARYEYGLGESILNIPLLRLSAGSARNPFAKPAGPDTLSTIMKTFLDDMDAVRATLERAKADGVKPFTLVLDDVWFDADMNSRRDRGEGVVETLGPMLLGRRAARELAKSGAGPMEVRFDDADLAWLVAYSHMLSGAGNGLLAFDPSPVLADMAAKRKILDAAPQLPEYYDQAEVQADIATLKAEQARVKQEADALRTEMRPHNKTLQELRNERRKPENRDLRAEIDAKIKAKTAAMADYRTRSRELSRARSSLRRELRAAEGKLTNTGSNRNSVAEFRPAFDAIYVTLAALRQEPDAARIKAMMTHWRAMIAENKRFWALVAQETDNDREWIPNAQQTQALGVEIDPQMAETWQAVLQDAEAVLTGRLLIPHPLLPKGYGISLAHYEQFPTRLDILGLIHGVGLYEHAAKGPRISAQNWQRFNRMTNGRAGMFSLFFN
ncbi:hypothetical protein N4R57_14445 [Rhodobacteraceae bacterium D3-12]|nr:hypothetical protein N4R57_14445 [Rhodobacteraceae bacterium D3-12]